MDEKEVTALLDAYNAACAEACKAGDVFDTAHMELLGAHGVPFDDDLLLANTARRAVVAWREYQKRTAEAERVRNGIRTAWSALDPDVAAKHPQAPAVNRTLDA